MSFIDKIKNSIPENVRPFVIRAAILIAAWELLYNFVLKPSGIPDDQLTRIVQLGAMKLLSFFYTDIGEDGNVIVLNGGKAVSIARQCNGLELIVLYLGFILCLPTNAKRMILFGVIGTLIIYILNIIRTALLAAMYDVNHSMTDFAHHYVFKIIIYAVVFLGWVLYMKKPKQHEATK
ncbi:MAG TPA: archaeosortase/exosortase family protein [Flavipsychrobacter sp.]